MTAIKVGGHFAGSLVLHWDDKLFIADTFVTVPVCDPLWLHYQPNFISSKRSDVKFPVRPHASPSASWPDLLLIHVVNSQYDTTANPCSRRHVEIPGTLLFQEHPRGICRHGCSRRRCKEQNPGKCTNSDQSDGRATRSPMTEIAAPQ